MRVAVSSIALTLILVASSCSDDGRSRGASDCTAQVRVDNTVYTSYGYTEQEAARHSVADRADCDDVGEDAAGSVFAEHQEQVATWSFRG